MRDNSQRNVITLLLLLFGGIILIAANSRGETNDIVLTYALLDIFSLVVYSSRGRS